MAEDRMLSDEILLGLIKSNSGGGGGGTDDYNDLKNQPQIEGVTLTGNKTASDLGLASEEDLEEKQDVLTAGNYVSITNDGTINVTKAIGVYDRVRYVFTPESGGYYMRVEVYINDVKRFEQQYQNTAVFNHVVIMELVEFWYGGDGYYWHYKTLIDSREHEKDIVISWYYTEMDVHEETFDVPQDDSTTLATKGDVENAIDTIKDGENIDSFAGVESALSNKQDKTDNNLTTEAKTIVGAINEHEGDIGSLKSGLTNKVGIASATDLNDEKSIGVSTFAYNTPNNPSNHSGSMLGLFQSESYGMQLAQSSSETEAYIRFFNTDTWSSWDKIATNSDLTNMLNFVITGTPDSAPFAENASGVTYAIKFNGATLGYLTIRPKNYLGAQNKPIAMELYDSSWGLVWLVLRDAK